MVQEFPDSFPGCLDMTQPLELRQLVRRMASDDPLWAEERMANELSVKLGIRVSPRTVGNYMPQRPPRRPRDH